MDSHSSTAAVPRRCARLAAWTAIAALLPACSPEAGPPGPYGEPGDRGPRGEVGPPGLACWDLDQDGACDGPTEDLNQDGRCDADDCRGADGSGGGPSSPYVGRESCATCHPERDEVFRTSGHGYATTASDGAAAPERPYDQRTGGIPAPPLGLSWSEIAYVVGGFGWKALYVGTEGYLITGAAGEATQWSFPNATVGTPGQWVAYHPGEQIPYDCGRCHDTGWVPCPVGDDQCQHQDGREGMAGSFVEAGVQCEGCHGPGAAHAAEPYLVPAVVDRTAAACGACHRRDQVEVIDALGGFIEHNQQYDELFQSKKNGMQCVACHDPHRSAEFVDEQVNPNRSIRIECLSCHVGYDTNQASALMVDVPCIECHMPPLVESAAGSVAIATGDVRSHLFAINPNGAAPQFGADGTTAEPYLTLQQACNHCHGVLADPRSLAELEATARHYHQN